jgi:hypothetical protein
MKKPLSERLVHVEEYDEFIHERALVDRWIINEVKKLEEQNKKLIDISKSLLQTFTPDRFIRAMMTREQYDDIEYVITNIEGEQQ